MRCLKISFNITLLICTAVGAAEVDPTSNLIGVNRDQIHKQLGPPTRTDEFFPLSKHCTVVEYYRKVASPDEIRRVTYNENGKVSASELEVSPNPIPKFMGKPVKRLVLNEKKLDSFLRSTPEEKLREMPVGQIELKLGLPTHYWRVTSRTGSKNWHFLNYQYSLSSDGRRAFVIMFNEDNHSIYEYRIQSVTN